MAAALTDIVARYRRGDISAEIAVMQLLLETEDVALARSLAADAPALLALLSANEAGCARIVRMLQRGDDDPRPAASVDAGLEATRRLFDRSVADDEQSSVALYSLGNPEILGAATAEVVDLLVGWGFVEPGTRMVELGCGIGRFLEALAPRVASIRGLDVSPGMVAAARRRCADLPNVRIDETSGRDLDGVATGSVDRVLAVDVFPYVVKAGPALVDALFGEIARVLVPGGELALLQFSYGELEGDREAVRGLADRHGFAVRVCGERPFALWDGSVFRLVRER